MTAEIANKLNNLVIVRKGLVDVVCDGKRAFYVATESSLKRCGGQGDVLSGSAGTLAHYAELKRKEQESKEPHEEAESAQATAGSLSVNPFIIAAVGSCIVTRSAAKQAYEKNGRALITPDIIKELNISKL